MSTKTSIKRIALVAVTALGFGMVTAVSPASAAETAVSEVSSVAITADTRVVRTGSSISLAATATTASADADDTLTVKAALSSQPATSSASLSFTSANRSITVSGGTTTYATVSGSTASLVATPGSGANFSDAAQILGSISFTPSVAGTYELVFWHDADNDDFLDSTEDYDTETISVAGAPTAIAFTKYGSGVGVAAAAGTVATYSGNHGVLIKVNIKDAAALNSGLAAGEYIRITPSTATGDIMAVNGTAVTYTPGTTTYYDLTYGDFNTSGNAFINVADSAAETLTLTLSGGGTAIASLSAATTATYKTRDADGNFSVLPTNCASSVGFEANTSPDFYVPLTSASSTICALGSTDFTAEAYGAVTVSDTSGKITGVDGSSSYTNDLAYTEAVLTDTDKKGSITVSHTFTAASQAFQIDVVTSGTGTSDGDYTSKAREVNSSSVTASPDVVRAATSSSVSITANVVDNFGSNLEAAQVVMTVSGRNSTATATKSSDSKGNAVFTLADAPAAGVTAVVDTVTFTAYYGAASDTGTAQVTWGGYTITTLTLTTDGDTDTVAGTTKTAIATGVAGATGTLGSTSATVKDANGLVLAGVPVTFTIAGTGCAIPSDKATVYTTAAGVAASNFYGWTVGSCVITATAGAVSATDTVYFKQEDATSARTISVAAAGNVVTATVKDRYGNGVKGATVWATRTGSGYFGTGSSATSGTTDVNGKVEFLVTPGTAETVVTVQLGSTSAASATYGQSADAAGYIGGNATTGTAVTAYVAGTSVTREVGVGSSLAPAGVNTATVTIEGATSGTSDAIDAANEATDAANAATDAANAAAEAADAATAAAQDAQAAVAELATKVASLIAGIKAQITSLTNLVIKIQKKVKA